MEFDRGLNFVRGFGSISWDSGNFVPSTAPGKFYIPLRFVAQENSGLTIIDDSSLLDSLKACIIYCEKLGKRGFIRKINNQS